MTMRKTPFIIILTFIGIAVSHKVKQINRLDKASEDHFRRDEWLSGKYD